MLKRLGIGNSLWSVARGLARNVRDYKTLLADADEPRHTALDGRGALSQTALIQFSEFFLNACVDQITYMGLVLEPGQLLNRINIYTQEEVAEKRLLKGSFSLFREALLFGEFERGKAEAITGYGERAARDVLSRLITKNLLVSDSPKSPVRLGFPIDVVDRWFPACTPQRKSKNNECDRVFGRKRGSASLRRHSGRLPTSQQTCKDNGRLLWARQFAADAWLSRSTTLVRAWRKSCRHSASDHPGDRRLEERSDAFAVPGRHKA
jgi:hypothetical protein